LAWLAGGTYDFGVLRKRVLVSSGEWAVAEVRCTGGGRGWSPTERADGYTLVFVRSGCFRRRVAGADLFADPCTAYFEQPGQEQQVAHPGPGGDVCLAIELSASLVAATFGGEVEVPVRPIFTDDALDLDQRLLVAAIRSHSGDPAVIEDRIVSCVAGAAARCRPSRVESGRPATVARRRGLVAGTRELLMLDPSLGLIELAALAGTSPHHLSRTFARETGEGVARYRNRLRMRLALERLAAGETSLARLAAELGFADQSHFCSVVRRAYGAPPSALRALLQEKAP
jgi:AraC-like DNA-binding protein